MHGHISKFTVEENQTACTTASKFPHFDSISNFSPILKVDLKTSHPRVDLIIVVSHEPHVCMYCSPPKIGIGISVEEHTELSLSLNLR